MDDQFDKYDLLLEILNYPYKKYVLSMEDINKQFNQVFKLMKEIGIDTEVMKFNLVLWNDDINTVDDVITALQEVCRTDLEASHNKTWEAHIKGKSIIYQGRINRVFPMIKRLKERGIRAGLEFAL